MYVMISTYTVPIEEVDKLRGAHLAFLDGLESEGKVVSAGRRTPPVGGVVVLNVATEAEARQIMAHDPYVLGGVGEYEAVGYSPSRGLLKDS